MRKQYHFWPGENGLDAWDVDRLIELSDGFPLKQVAIEAIWEVDTPYWSQPLTVRDVAEHVRLVQAVDPSYPIILGADGRVMDGMHRVVRALLEGQTTISAVQFDVHPDPDYRNSEPDQLPYPDDD
jgi:arginase family enzyme